MTKEQEAFLNGNARHPMSQKQRDFIESIAEELDIEMDVFYPNWRNWDSDEASDFITNNQDEYYESTRYGHC